MKEEVLELLKDRQLKERTLDDLAKRLNQTETNDYIALIKCMNALEDEGEVIRDRANRYYTPDQMNFVRGILNMNKRGFGFVRVDETREIHISEANLKDAYQGDEVLVEVYYLVGKEEGRIIKVLKRGMTKLVGEVIQGRKDLIVIPDDTKFTKRIIVDAQHAHGAVAGHKVIVEIKSYRPQIKGEIIQILGHKNDPGVDILSIIKAHDVEIDFPQAVYNQIEGIGDTIDYRDMEGRVDLRDEMIVTIDGDDAKDLDDAISLKKLENGHDLLGVHIADVSYYVEEGTPLDQEALSRGTSIYVVDRVIPMLPHKLSNGICSLNEGVDRYAISCFMEIDRQGQVVNHDIKPTIIRSKHRMTYTNVNKILMGDRDLWEEYADAVDLFMRMRKLAKTLRQKRDQKGAIDFDVAEAKVILDEKGHTKEIVPRERGVSDHIIEEFMLCANETVAEHFKWMDLPFIYRVHENPKKDKLKQFIAITRPLGYRIHGSIDNVHPAELSRIIAESKDEKEHTVIATLLLRSMQKARYEEQCLGHFGLADEYYTHFTSPIRRYPDLLVHRLIRTYLFNNDYDKVEHFAQVIPEIADQSSRRERIAIDTERDVEDMKKAEYMEKHIGEVYEGVISSVTSFGFFVELENTIEGLVHMTTLIDDYYVFDDKNLVLIGEHTNRVFRLGNRVKIRVSQVNKKERTIDFEIVQHFNKKKRLIEKTTKRKRRR